MKKLFILLLVLFSFELTAQNRIGEHIFETLESETYPVVFKKDSIYTQLQFVEFIGEKEYRRLYLYAKDTCIAYILRAPLSEKNLFFDMLNSNNDYKRNNGGWADWPNKTVIWIREDKIYMTLEFYHVEKGNDIKSALRLFSKKPYKKI